MHFVDFILVFCSMTIKLNLNLKCLNSHFMFKILKSVRRYIIYGVRQRHKQYWRVSSCNTDKSSGGPVGYNLISLRISSEDHTSTIPTLIQSSHTEESGVLPTVAVRRLKELILMVQRTLDRGTLREKVVRDNKTCPMHQTSNLKF